MAKEINQKLLEKLTGIVKKSPGQSETFYVEQSGIERAQILRYLVKAELAADPSLKIVSNGKAILKARQQGVRWPRIAARTGISESKAKELYESEAGHSASSEAAYTGRGRKTFGNGGSSASKSSSKGGTAANKKAAATTAATSGRRRGRVSAAASKATAAPARDHRGTRRSAASDPK